MRGKDEQYLLMVTDLMIGHNLIKGKSSGKNDKTIVFLQKKYSSLICECYDCKFEMYIILVRNTLATKSSVTITALPSTSQISATSNNINGLVTSTLLNKTATSIKKKQFLWER